MSLCGHCFLLAFLSLQESIQPTPDGCNPFPEIPFQGMFSQAAIRSCGKPRVLHWKFARAVK